VIVQNQYFVMDSRQVQLVLRSLAPILPLDGTIEMDPTMIANIMLEARITVKISEAAMKTMA
jgi:hypothetical protein